MGLAFFCSLCNFPNTQILPPTSPHPKALLLHLRLRLQLLQDLKSIREVCSDLDGLVLEKVGTGEGSAVSLFLSVTSLSWIGSALRPTSVSCLFSWGPDGRMPSVNFCPQVIVGRSSR